MQRGSLFGRHRILQHGWFLIALQAEVIFALFLWIEERYLREGPERSTLLPEQIVSFSGMVKHKGLLRNSSHYREPAAAISHGHDMHPWKIRLIGWEKDLLDNFIPPILKEIAVDIYKGVTQTSLRYASELRSIVVKRKICLLWSVFMSGSVANARPIAKSLCFQKSQ